MQYFDLYLKFYMKVKIKKVTNEYHNFNIFVSLPY